MPSTSLYDIFKIIFGIVASVMILAFVLNYTDVFSSLQKGAQSAKTVENFKKAAEEVYLTGNPSEFGGFSRIWPEISFLANEDPPAISYASGRSAILTPVLFSPGSDILITRATEDYGWWRFDSAIALPETVIVFNPVESSQENTDIIYGIAGIFSASYAYSPNVTFGVCSGSSIDAYMDYSGLDYRLKSAAALEKCEAEMPENFRLAAFSSDCTGFSGVCFAGNAAHIGEDTFAYSDALDMAFLIIGGDKEDVFGSTKGANLFKYKKRVFAERISLASQIASKRLGLIIPELKSAMDSINAGDFGDAACSAKYSRISGMIDSAISRLSSGNVNAAGSLMESIEAEYEEAKSGCIRLPSTVEIMLECSIFGFTKLRPAILHAADAAVYDHTDVTGAAALSQALEESRQKHTQYVQTGCVL